MSTNNTLLTKYIMYRYNQYELNIHDVFKYYPFQDQFI